MLAVVGFIATDFVRVPGEMYSFDAIPKTIDAHDALLKSGPMYQLLLFIGLFDFVITAPAAMAASKGLREPGGKYQFDRNSYASTVCSLRTRFHSPSTGPEQISAGPSSHPNPRRA